MNTKENEGSLPFYKEEKQPVNLTVYLSKCFYEANGKRTKEYTLKEVQTEGHSQEVAQQLGVVQSEAIIPWERLTLMPTTNEELKLILGCTIKSDEYNKAITFYNSLLTYTEEDQTNTGFRGESAGGKSYLPLEIASYFPREELLILGYCSPTAFFHDVGEWNKEKRVLIVDLRQKILIFLDQPHDLLLQRLRPLLSHDQKEIQTKITDRSEKFGLRTKNVIMRGFPTVFFCSAKLDSDAQEKTRMFLLTPETSQEKLKQSMELLGNKLGNRYEFKEKLESDFRRYWLRNRIRAIKTMRFKDVLVDNSVCKRFIEEHKKLAPRHQRDLPRLYSLIKGITLWNYPQRERAGSDRLIATQEDIELGFELYNQIKIPNELGLSPEVWDIFKKVVRPVIEEYGVGERKDFLKEYHEEYGRYLDVRRLNKEILPSLLGAGLVYEDKDIGDKRKKVFYLTFQKQYDKPVWGIEKEEIKQEIID